MLETGFAIFILFRHLIDHDPSIAHALSPHDMTGGLDPNSVSSYHRALAFFEQHTKSVEIVRVRSAAWCGNALVVMPIADADVHVRVCDCVRACVCGCACLGLDRTECWSGSTSPSLLCACT